MQFLSESVSSEAHHILLIEDNDHDAVLLFRHLEVLKEQGVTVEHCQTLVAGLSRLERGDIDLILLDLSLPDSYGINTLKKVHRAAPSVPLIVLTGSDDHNMAIESLRCGAQDYLSKDRIDLSSLCRSINYAIARLRGTELADRLAAIVEASDDSILSKTLKGKITSWNRGAEELYGYSGEEAIGSSVAMLIPASSPQELPEILEKVSHGESIHDMETVRVKKSGEEIDVSVCISPIKETDGTVTGAASIAHDITHRKNNERELKELQQRLSLALKAGAVGVWDVDLIKSTIWRSQRHDEIFGYDPHLEKWNFETFLGFVFPDDRPLAIQMHESALKTGHFEFECRIVRTDKVLRWITTCGEMVKDEHGSPIRVMGTVIDITDRKQQEEQRRVMAIMQEREDFIATLAHDMKNPLIGANRLLELFVAGRIGELTTQQHDLLLSLLDSNAGVLRLVADFMDVYRWEKDAHSLSFENTDLCKLLSVSVKQITPIAKLRNIKVTLNLPKQMASISADFLGLQRVLLNLLDNALKFTKPEGTIDVRLQAQDNEAIIEVEDNGVGIPPAERHLLFKRFSQGSSGKRHTGGSGLGLYLCKQITERHGGSIECSSELNKATIFRMILPLKLSSAAIFPPNQEAVKAV